MARPNDPRVSEAMRRTLHQINHRHAAGPFASIAKVLALGIVTVLVMALVIEAIGVRDDVRAELHHIKPCRN